jgi:hypothetical protein
MQSISDLFQMNLRSGSNMAKMVTGHLGASAKDWRAGGPAVQNSALRDNVAALQTWPDLFDVLYLTMSQPVANGK